MNMGFPGGTKGKEVANSGDIRDEGSIPELGRSPGGGNGNPLQYSWLENPMDRGAWWATVYRITKLDMTEVTEPAWTVAHQVLLSRFPRQEWV